MTTRFTIEEIEKARYDLQNLIKEALNYYQQEYGMTLEELHFSQNHENDILSVVIIDRLSGNKYVFP